VIRGQAGTSQQGTGAARAVARDAVTGGVGGPAADGEVAALPQTLPPPEHVLRAFGAIAAAELLEGGHGRTWRAENIVLKPVGEPAAASWLASTIEQLHVAGVRLARPVRSSDGRWVVSGWCANRFVTGSPAPRHEDILQVGIALHDALAQVPEPRFLRSRSDLHSWADRVSWGDIEDTEGRIGSGHGARLFAELAAGRRPVDVYSQVVHGDLFGKVLFAGNAPPAVIDITPYWRPAAWAAGVIAVDGLAWGGAPIEQLDEWDRWPHWRQLLRRAVLFRLAVSLAHPRTPPSDLVTMLSTAERIAQYLD
jgi:uncharacterized protein (TIGR02569 family)